MSDVSPVVLVTGAAKRVGAVIARRLHARGCVVAMHYRRSRNEAEALARELEGARAGSTLLLQADLDDAEQLETMVSRLVERCGRLDGVVNNASTFFTTPFGSVTPAQWDQLFSANARGPFFLTQAAAAHLREAGGAIVNVLDVYAERALPRYSAYSMSKAALRMLTFALARELGPEVRVNAVAPGTVLWSDNPVKAESDGDVRDGTALGRVGTPEDVAEAVAWLLLDAHYTTGAVVPVEGGRLLNV